MDIYLIVYLVGVVIWAGVMLDDFSWPDWWTSILLGLTWPITLPIEILRKILR